MSPEDRSPYVKCKLEKLRWVSGFIEKIGKNETFPDTIPRGRLHGLVGFYPNVTPPPLAFPKTLSRGPPSETIHLFYKKYQISYLFFVMTDLDKNLFWPFVPCFNRKAFLEINFAKKRCIIWGEGEGVWSMFFLLLFVFFFNSQFFFLFPFLHNPHIILRFVFRNFSKSVFSLLPHIYIFLDKSGTETRRALNLNG